MVKVNSLRGGSATLRHLNPICKKGPQRFFLKKVLSLKVTDKLSAYFG